MVSLRSPSNPNQTNESIDIISIGDIFNQDICHHSSNIAIKFYNSSSSPNLRRSKLESRSTLTKLRRRALSINFSKISKKLESGSIEFLSESGLVGPAKESKKNLKASKSLYESLIEVELQQFTKRKMSLKDSVLYIIKSQDGSRYLQDLLKDLPKECFRLLFLEVSP